MPKVVVLQDNPNADINFLPAEKFGEVHVLFSRPINAFQVPRLVSSIRGNLRGVGITSEDYFVPIGNPSMIAVAGFIWMDMVGSMKILNWDRQERAYAEFEVKGI